MTTKLSLPELKSLCKENKIKGYSKLKKDEIIDLLKNNNIEMKSSLRSEVEDVSKKMTDLKISNDKKEDKKTNKTEKKEEKEEIDDKLENEIKKYYEFKNDKSNKFWEIKYEDNKSEKRKYIVRYGSTDTSGKTVSPKLDTIKNIEKLIETKIKKGYEIVK